MSGIIGGIDYNLLFSGRSATSDIASSILGALYGGGTAAASTAVSTGNPLTDLKLAQANEAKGVAQEAKTPQVQRDIAAFQSGVAKAKDIQAALANPNVMKVLLTANNLSRYIQYPALAQKALLSDPGQSDSLVNKLADPSLLSIAARHSPSPPRDWRRCKIRRSSPRSPMPTARCCGGSRWKRRHQACRTRWRFSARRARSSRLTTSSATR